MKIVVLGGTGLIGKKVVGRLQSLGHEVVAASPSTGVNTVSNEGVEKVFRGADIVVDVSNSPSFEDKAVMDFFVKSTGNVLNAAKNLSVKKIVILSVVGTERLKDSGYFRAKLKQEELLQQGGIPFTIVRSTQFMEFLDAIAESGKKGEEIYLSTASFQPIAAEDVGQLLSEIVLEEAVNGIIDIAGPEKGSLAEIIGKYLKAKGDIRKVIADPESGYFGSKLEEDSLVPLANARLGSTRI